MRCTHRDNDFLLACCLKAFILFYDDEKKKEKQIQPNKYHFVLENYAI